MAFSSGLFLRSKRTNLVKDAFLGGVLLVRSARREGRGAGCVHGAWVTVLGWGTAARPGRRSTNKDWGRKSLLCPRAARYSHVTFPRPLAGAAVRTPGKSEQFLTWQELGLEVTLLLPVTPPRPSGQSRRWAAVLLLAARASELPNTPLTADSTPHPSVPPKDFHGHPLVNTDMRKKKWPNRW